MAYPARLQVFRALVVAGPRGMTPGLSRVELLAEMRKRIDDLSSLK